MALTCDIARSGAHGATIGCMTSQYRGKTYERDDGREVIVDARWVETRNGMPLVRPYVWRGPRSRLATMTRKRVERALAAGQ